MKKNPDIAAAILAGGKNLRMGGRNKAFISIAGRPILDRTFDILKNTFEEVIIVTNYPSDFKTYKKNSVITEDLIKGAGPLGGMHSALSATSKEAVFFIACDMPNLHNAFMLDLANYFKKTNFDAVLPRIGKELEPLAAIYKKELKNKLKAFLDSSKDYSIKNFVRTINVGFFDLEDKPLNRKMFINLNSPQDIKNFSTRR